MDNKEIKNKDLEKVQGGTNIPDGMWYYNQQYQPYQPYQQYQPYQEQLPYCENKCSVCETEAVAGIETERHYLAR